MDKILKVTVVYGAQVFDLGECDADHISLINLVHAMTKEVSGSSELPSGGFTVRTELPWSRDTIVVLTNSELLDVFRKFGNREYDQIRFQIENTPHSPIDEPEVVEQIGWCNKEAGMFDFTVESEGEDTESDDTQFEEGVDSDDDTGEGVNSGVGNGEGVHAGEGLDGDVVDDDEITKQCMALFDGYESKSDDDYFTDHDEESSDKKKIKISLGNLSEVELVKALQTHFPLASTRFCARHIYANFRSSFPGHNYKKMFWKASRSSNLFHFNAALDSIEEVDPNAKQWLMKIDPHCWSRFGYDKYIRCDHVTNNMTKAFNSMLGTHRAQTYLQLLEFIRCMVMRKLQEMKEECEAWRDVLPPRVNARILKNSQASRQLTIISAGDQEYELLGLDGTFPVKLKEYYCGCGSWQISGFPCPHAMVAIKPQLWKTITKGLGS
ncbi:hypothetical protein Ddye_020684 [Dipteronia dyeriana]|uniref:SWIM-type domain-containing protein n=1 Tax=Dipteronia dyeriana TaxID=168575 RepID=A0AAD9U065_9ROSI|nr:hypothetical protein Ddye_020684 [Dipteronia dyeriana]